MHPEVKSPLVIVAIALAAAFAIPPPSTATEIRLKSEARIAAAIVYLADVAEIVSDHEGEAAPLGRVPIMPAPASGAAHKLTRRELADHLELRLPQAAAFRYGGASATMIRGIDPNVRPAAHALPAAEAAPPVVAVAASAVRAGQVLAAADVTVVPVQANARLEGAIHDPAEVVGKEATRPFAAGQPFDGRYVRTPLLVRRNEVVTVMARAAGITVRTTAKVLEDGSHGELVTVESLQGKQKYTARVVGHQQVEVFARGTTVEGLPPPEIPPR
jgi:flagella basal body P-ring formation protein FlgA